MTRSPDSLIPSSGGQPSGEKRDDKASSCRQGGEANPRAATEVNAVSTPAASIPTQLEFFPGRACLLEAKPGTGRRAASSAPVRRDGVEGGGTRREFTEITGEIPFGPQERFEAPGGREANKGGPRNRRPEAGREVGGGRSTDEPRENRGEERTAASTTRSKRGKAARLRPRGSASPRRKSTRPPKRPQRMDKASNCRERYTERPSSNQKGGSLFSTTRYVGRISWRRRGSG